MIKNYNAELWMPIEGWEGIYEVSNLTRIRSIQRYINGPRNSKKIVRERYLTQVSDKLGYKRICLHKDGRQKGYLVHQLIAKAFIPNPQNKPHINHKDGNPSNNSIENLEWCTPSENITHSYRKLGRINPQQGKTKEKNHLYGKKGTNHPASKANSKMVVCLSNGITYLSTTDAAKKLRISQTGVSMACRSSKSIKGYKFEFVQ